LQILTEEQVLAEEPMSRHTTFRVGGPAEYFLRPRREEIPQVVALCRRYQMPLLVVGNGSNLLVGDRGIRGIVLEIGPRMSEISVTGTRVVAEAGATLARVAGEAAANSLTGAEFAGGIPGTLGGAVMMNAGAYGGEIRDILVGATVLEPDGSIREYLTEELELSYRHSVLERTGGIVLSAVLKLQEGEEQEIRRRMEELRQKRTDKQPLEYPSAGSTFKRPEGHFAGKLIMDAGLAGYRVGGAQVSEKHCGFVINRAQASAADIRQLMQEVSQVVYERFQVRLEPEVKIVGEWESFS
jgi:UDP-N-acetylmuramate dehydrogenase